MLELLQFSLSDMVMYSRQTYIEMMGLYNQAIWPTQVPAMALALRLLYIVLNQGRQNIRVVFLGLGVAWLWSGLVFHMRHYSSINWAAPAFGYLFAVQGFLLIAVGCFPKAPVWKAPRKWLVWVNQALFIMAVLVYPLACLLEGRTPMQLELFALTPAPTLIATFALLLFVDGHWRYWLVLIPVLWSFISGSFSWELQLLEAYAVFTALLVWLMNVGSEVFRLNMRKAK